jgi:hypothetical protein
VATIGTSGPSLTHDTSSFMLPASARRSSSIGAMISSSKIRGYINSINTVQATHL